MDSSFLNEVKKLFKSKQRIAEEEAQRIKDAIEKEQTVVETLKELERQYEADKSKKPETDYGNTLPDKINLERITHIPKSNEEIKEQVADELKAGYIKNINDIDNKLLQKAIKLNEKNSSIEVDRKATSAEIEALFDTLKSKAEKDALKRGIQRSSIIAESLKEYDLAKTNNLQEAEKAYKKAVENINAELDSLNEQREKALAELDLSQATKMTERISELTKERDELSNEVTIKNNAITQEEMKANMNLAKQKEELEKKQSESAKKELAEQDEYEKKYGYSADKQQNYAERYNIALDFYLSLDPDIAVSALEASSNMKHYLGNYYDKLHEVLTKRGRHTNKYL